MSGVAGVETRAASHTRARTGVVAVTNSAPNQAQAEHRPAATDNQQVTYPDTFIRRKISVKGTGGATATVVVTAQLGQVWVSVQPLFTWDAIMEPEKVDELMRALTLAQDEAKRLESGERVGKLTELPRTKAAGTKKIQP